MSKLPVQLVLSAREYDVLRDLVQRNIDDTYHARRRTQKSRPTSLAESHENAAAFRAATRVYFGTTLSLKLVDSVLRRIRARRNPTAVPVGLSIPRHRLALSLSSLLFFHRVLYRFFTRLRLQLLHEKVKDIKDRYPMIYSILTSRYAPAVGASLSGLALGVYPASQLRITITIFVLVRALENVYKSAEALGLLKNKPRWMGSWMIFALAQGQLLHSFVFDNDCFPQDYATLIMNNTHEYIQKKPANMSDKVVWPGNREIVDSIAEMARLNWPPFVSPILHPTRKDTLPATVNPIIDPITSRAHPSIQHLSCALLHPSDTSCFTPYLRQLLLSFTTLARFFTLYYGAFSLLSIRKLFQSPGPFLNKLSMQILKTTLTICGAIGTSWGSICLFNNVLPKRFLPTFRFFLGGALGGCFAIVDQTASGHSNALYALRSSLDSFWKVGKKRGWWKGVKGGDVCLFIAALTAMNVVYDRHRNGQLGKDSSLRLVRLLRGEVELGLKDGDDQPGQNEKSRQAAPKQE